LLLILGFHAEYTSTPEILAKLSEIANELKAPIYTHISETEKEVEGSIKRHGATPAVYFDRLGLFNYGGGGYHGVAFKDEDFAVFKSIIYQLLLVQAQILNLQVALLQSSAF